MIVDLTVVRAKVLPWMLGVLDQIPGFRAALIKFAEMEFHRVLQRNQKWGKSNADRIAELQAEADRLATAIAKGGNLEALIRKSAEVDADLQKVRAEAAQLQLQAQEANDFTSIEEIGNRLDEVLKR